MRPLGRKGRKKARVYFVVPAGEKIWGSSFLRGQQMLEIAQRHLGERYDFALMAMPVWRERRLRFAVQKLWAATRPRDCIYFVTKQCVLSLDPFSAEVLRARARAVLFDYVDADMATVPMRGADVHLCASYAQFDYIASRLPEMGGGAAELLLHSYDARLERRPPSLDGPLRAVYCGAPQNTHIPDGLTEKIAILKAGSAKRMPKFFEELYARNLHYCVRPAFSPRTAVFKPFTKGAVAAASGANVLVNRGVHDAVKFLGEDYPYLVDDLDDAAILNRFALAEEGVGGSEWRHAQAAMVDVAFRLSPERSAAQLDSILEPLVA